MDQPSKIVMLKADHTLNAEVAELVRLYSLVHGDVVTEDEDRFALAKIVSYDESTNSYKLIQNPDDSGSGYLTIPHDILAQVKDFKGKYSKIIEESPSINFYIANDDSFITNRFGSDVPEEYEFNIEYTWGDMESFYVRNKPSAEWKDFEFERVTLEQMKDHFSVSDKPKAQFRVKVQLKGAKLKEYKKKYTTSGEYSWISARPELPTGWECEMGGGSAGSDFKNWSWKCKGPADQKDAAINSVKSFLSSFDYEMEMSD